jgi:hypothetical protein
MKVKTSLACLGLIALSGCANTLLSDERLRDNTAMALGQPEESITISNRRDDGITNTYYIAHTPHGTFNCSINGGSILDAGMVNAPRCMRL